MSHASQKFGRSGCNCSRLPGLDRISRPSAITEVISPLSSNVTRTKPFSLHRSVTTTAGESTADTAAAPDPGTEVSTPSTTSLRARGLVLKTSDLSPEPATEDMAALVVACSSAATAAYFASASLCTHAIELPGRMSWNWCSRTTFQSRSKASYG